MNLQSFKKRIRWVKRILIAVLLLVASVAVGLAFVSIDEKYLASGVVRPGDELTIYSPHSGFIEEVCAYEEQFVPKGGLLYRMDTWDLQQRKISQANQRRMLTAQLELQQTKIARAGETALPQWLQFSNIDAERSKTIVEHRQEVLGMLEKLVSDGLISRLEYDRAKLDLTQAEADQDRNAEKLSIVDSGYIARAIAEAKAEAMVLQANLDNLTALDALLDEEFRRREIRAPEGSTVTLVLARSPGEMVREGEELMYLRTSEARSLDLYGGEKNIHRVHEGQKIIFETEAFSSILEGYCLATLEVVASDSDFGNSNGQGPPTARYYLGARIDSSPFPLKFGTTVQAEIALRRTPIYKVLFNLD